MIHHTAPRWRALGLALASLALAPAAQAALVTCGNAALGDRTVQVDGGLSGGYCHAQSGNLQNADITGLGLTLLAKEVAADGDVASPLLSFTVGAGNASGTWALAEGEWASWGHLYLALHFGNATTRRADSPDSFIVELARDTRSGTFALAGAGISFTGLSNLYLIGDGICTTCDGPQSLPPPGGGSVPVPAPWALLGAAGVAALLARRARAQA